MMKLPRRYASAAAFRVALECRLKNMAQEGGFDLQRLRRQAAFDRLLCRLFAIPDAPWLLKGGYAMELRLKTARTTRDIDLAIRRLPVVSADWDANVSAVLESLREAGNLDLSDFFNFVFGNATQDLDAAHYGGARFPVDARLAGRTFAKFHLDVSTGGVLREPYEMLSGRDWLGFAGIASATFPAVSPEEQFAEKLHAYTLPRTGRENTRVKDLRFAGQPIDETFHGLVKHIVVLKGGMGAKQRRAIAEQMTAIPDGEERVLLATGRYIGEGFDDRVN